MNNKVNTTLTNELLQQRLLQKISEVLNLNNAGDKRIELFYLNVRMEKYLDTNTLTLKCMLAPLLRIPV